MASDTLSNDKLRSFRILNPYPGIYAYYDGRTGYRFHSDKPNWLDDGAFTLGVASYAIVSNGEALIFDAHITTEHAAAVLRHVQSVGAVSKITIVYSHAHTDHIAGAQAYQGHTIIGSEETAAWIKEDLQELSQLDPPINAVVPTQTFSGQLTLQVGDVEVQLHSFNIHTSDSIVLWIPSRCLLFAGDTLEDTATYISEAKNLSIHQTELRRMASHFAGAKILPAHGHPERIAEGGYETSFIEATDKYIAALNEDVEEPAAWSKSLAEVVAEDLAQSRLLYYKQYEEVHKANIQAIKTLRGEKA